MSIEAYEEMNGRLELYRQIQAGMDDIAEGRIRSFSDAMSDLKGRREK